MPERMKLFLVDLRKFTYVVFYVGVTETNGGGRTQEHETEAVKSRQKRERREHPEMVLCSINYEDGRELHHCQQEELGT